MVCLGVVLASFSVWNQWTADLKVIGPVAAWITEVDKAQVPAAYKDVVAAREAQLTGIYEVVVVKGLLGLFNSIVTAVLAFIFAPSGIELVRALATRVGH
jgi:hypothetical protein